RSWARSAPARVARSWRASPMLARKAWRIPPSREGLLARRSRGGAAALRCFPLPLPVSLAPPLRPISLHSRSDLASFCRRYTPFLSASVRLRLRLRGARPRCGGELLKRVTNCGDLPGESRFFGFELIQSLLQRRGYVDRHGWPLKTRR